MINVFTFHFHITTVTWVTEPTTGNEYTVLKTSTLNRQEAKDTCARYGGILPEPNTYQENHFIAGLDAQVFLLGMNDKESEGTWRWDSNDRRVGWLYLAARYPPRGLYQNRRSNENCVVMFKYLARDRVTWNYVQVPLIPCVDNLVEKIDIDTVSLVCQKVFGMYRCGNIDT